MYKKIETKMTGGKPSTKKLSAFGKPSSNKNPLVLLKNSIINLN
jgi:hypothetical protein